MLLSLFKSSIPVSVIPFRTDYYHLQRVQVERNGNLFDSVDLVKLDFAQQNKQFTFTDFNLSNIIASGATHLLKPTQFDNVNIDKVIDDTLTALNHAQELQN